MDLRLVPPALAAWATAALTLDAAPGLVGGLVLGCLAVAATLLVVRRGSARNASLMPDLRNDRPRVDPGELDGAGAASRREASPDGNVGEVGGVGAAG
ncbi:hypothetical protein ACWD5A_21435, partial [Streptomyces sp. NPDC002491]